MNPGWKKEKKSSCSHFNFPFFPRELISFVFMSSSERTIVLTSWQCWGMQKEKVKMLGFGGWDLVTLPNMKCYQITMLHMPWISIHQIKQPGTPQRLCIQTHVQFQPYFTPNYHIIIIALLLGCCVVGLVYTALRGVLDMVLTCFSPFFLLLWVTLTPEHLQLLFSHNWEDTRAQEDTVCKNLHNNQSLGYTWKQKALQNEKHFAVNSFNKLKPGTEWP